MRSEAASWRALAILLALVLLAFVDRQIVTLAAAPLSRDLGLTDTQLGLAQGLTFALFTMLATYPVAWLADRFDRRLVLAACLIVWTAGTLGCGLSRTFDQLFLACIAIAAGEAAVTPIALSAVPDLFTGPRRVTAYLLFYAASTLGGSLAWLLGGSAFAAISDVDLHLPQALASTDNWRLAFLIVAAPAPLLLVALLGLRISRATDRDAEPEAGRMLPYLRAHGPTLALVLGALACIGFALGGLLAWAPVSLARLFAMKPDAVGLGMGVAMAVGAVGGIFAAGWTMRRLSLRLGARAGVRTAFYAAAAGVPLACFLPFAGAPGLLFGVIALVMGAGTVIGSITPKILQDIAPDRLRSRVVAIYTMSYICVNGLGALAAGLLSDGLGGAPRDTLVGLGILGAGGWLSAALLFRIADTPYGRTAAGVQSLTGSE